MLPVAIFIPRTEHFGEKAVCVSICLQGGEERGKGRGRSQQRWAGALGRKPGGPVGGSTGCVEAEKQQGVSLPEGQGAQCHAEESRPGSLHPWRSSHKARMWPGLKMYWWGWVLTEGIKHVLPGSHGHGPAPCEFPVHHRNQKCSSAGTTPWQFWRCTVNYFRVRCAQDPGTEQCWEHRWNWVS